MLLIAMAGLPGSGKSTLAAALAERVGGLVLNKDAIRAAMFAVVEYSRGQDDAVLARIYDEAAARIATQPVIIDGRTFSKAYQVRDLFAAAARMGTEPKIIECVASDEAVKARLERDIVNGTHPAKNRIFEMYLAVKAAADPITVPRLTLDTGSQSMEHCLEAAERFISSESSRPLI